MAGGILQGEKAAILGGEMSLSLLSKLYCVEQGYALTLTGPDSTKGKLLRSKEWFSKTGLDEWTWKWSRDDSNQTSSSLTLLSLVISSINQPTFFSSICLSLLCAPSLSLVSLKLLHFLLQLLLPPGFTMNLYLRNCIHGFILLSLHLLLSIGGFAQILSKRHHVPQKAVSLCVSENHNIGLKGSGTGIWGGLSENSAYKSVLRESEVLYPFITSSVFLYLLPVLPMITGCLGNLINDNGDRRSVRLFTSRFGADRIIFLLEHDVGVELSLSRPLRNQREAVTRL
ncbi:hypothetical protein DNTS_013438 [Danionella cerebrum]|uniref:Uncharacterized protein n=1 Tax=Danionella cerebrum TaxID=2873325 RepID=A0A553RGX8_9TELE|nr:hypothetical protein DNTS_013438 [Danionella translucida]